MSAGGRWGSVAWWQPSSPSLGRSAPSGSAALLLSAHTPALGTLLRPHRCERASGSCHRALTCPAAVRTGSRKGQRVIGQHRTAGVVDRSASACLSAEPGCSGPPGMLRQLSACSQCTAFVNTCVQPTPVVVQAAYNVYRQGPSMGLADHDVSCVGVH